MADLQSRLALYVPTAHAWAWTRFGQLALCFIAMRGETTCHAEFEDDPDRFILDGGTAAKTESLCRHFTMALSLCRKGYPTDLSDLACRIKAAADDAKAKFITTGEQMAAGQAKKLDRSATSLGNNASKHNFVGTVTAAEMGDGSSGEVVRNIGESATD